MDAAWVGVVGALAGVALTGGLSLVGGVLGRRHDRSERRYEVRRDAYVAFNADVQRALGSIRDFVAEISEYPRDRDIDEVPRDLRQVLSLVVLVGPEEVATAAREVSDAVEAFGYGQMEYAEADRVRGAFVTAAQRALGLT